MINILTSNLKRKRKNSCFHAGKTFFGSRNHAGAGHWLLPVWNPSTLHFGWERRRGSGPLATPRVESQYITFWVGETPRERATGYSPCGIPPRGDGGGGKGDEVPLCLPVSLSLCLPVSLSPCLPVSLSLCLSVLHFDICDATASHAAINQQHMSHVGHSAYRFGL